MTTAPSPDALAREVFDAISAPRQIAAISGRVPDFDRAAAYAVSARVKALGGAPSVGRKIGFTNRTIWERYGVDGPMWGDMTDASLTPVSDEPVSLAPFCEPRLEPEVALRLAADPTPDMDEEALLGIVEWFAPAFEIVHSIYPSWRFTLADCIAANALHGRLLLGPPTAPGDWARGLPDMELTLSRGGTPVETGVGENVLGGPLSALRDLVATLAADGGPALRKGEIISTGTITDAWPIAPGDTFSASYGTTPLATITARFAA